MICISTVSHLERKGKLLSWGNWILSQKLFWLANSVCCLLISWYTVSAKVSENTTWNLQVTVGNVKWYFSSLSLLSGSKIYMENWQECVLWETENLNPNGCVLHFHGKCWNRLQSISRLNELINVQFHGTIFFFCLLLIQVLSDNCFASLKTLWQYNGYSAVHTKLFSHILKHARSRQNFYFCKK